jgi:hypothetical protein
MMKTGMFLAVWIGASASPLFGQSPMELLKLAAESAQDKAISAAEIRFNAELHTPSLEPQGLIQIQKRQEEGIKAAIEMYKDQPEQRKKYEALLAKNDAAVASQAEAYRNIRIIGLYRLFGPLLGGDRLYEAKIQKGTDPARDTHLLQRFLDEKTVRAVHYDVRSRITVVSATAASVGIPDPVSLGRLSGPVLAGLQYEGAISCQFDESFVPNNPGERCINFEVHSVAAKESSGKTSRPNEAQTLVGKVVVDSSRGYVCPLLEFGSPDKEPDLSIKCLDFFQVKGTGVWFPGSCQIRAKKADGLHVSKILFRPEDIVLNKRLSPELFSITIPAGTTLLYQLGQPQQRKAYCDVRIDVDGLDTLLGNKCLLTPSGEPVRRSPLLLYASLAIFVTMSLLYLGVRQWKRK